MQTYSEAARAIHESLKRAGFRAPREDDGGKIMDLNGNSVGTWEVQP